jgi:hypothetical protein
MIDRNDVLVVLRGYLSYAAGKAIVGLQSAKDEQPRYHQSLGGEPPPICRLSLDGHPVS